jgi:hypothetical protein
MILTKKVEEVTMAETFDYQLAILMKEWDQCEAGIGRYDTIMFSIRTWAVTLSTATAGAAASLKSPNILLIGIVPAILLYLIDSTNKSYQFHFTQRVREIQAYLSSQDFKDDSTQKAINFRTPVFASNFPIGRLDRLKAVKMAALRMSVWITYASILLINVIAYCGFQLAGIDR